MKRTNWIKHASQLSTKEIISDYIEDINDTIDSEVRSGNRDIKLRELLEELVEIVKKKELNK